MSPAGPFPIAIMRKVESAIAALPPDISLLALRLALAVPFFRSGLTKWESMVSLTPATHYLFANEFKLHVFGQAYSYPFPDIAAWASSIAEIALPILLVLGLLTRLSAFGLLIMTAVIQLTIPDGWANFHLPWAAMALALMAFGAGRWSMDGLLLGSPVPSQARH